MILKLQQKINEIKCFKIFYFFIEKLRARFVLQKCIFTLMYVICLISGRHIQVHSLDV